MGKSQTGPVVATDSVSANADQDNGTTALRGISWFTGRDQNTDGGVTREAREDADTGRGDRPGVLVWALHPRGKDLPRHSRHRESMGRRSPPMCPNTPEDYNSEEEVRKLRTKQKQEARGRREQAERRT